MQTTYQCSFHNQLGGVKKDQINLDVRDNTLVISGETKKDEQYHEGMPSSASTYIPNSVRLAMERWRVQPFLLYQTVRSRVMWVRPRIWVAWLFSGCSLMKTSE